MATKPPTAQPSREPSARAAPPNRTNGYVFIVNPRGGGGKAYREWKKASPRVKEQLGESLVYEELTTGAGSATELARDAIKGGAKVVVAVGGDGTINEVVNGFFEDGELTVAGADCGGGGTALAVMPAGTGSDFARTFGWTSSTDEALLRITGRERRAIDVGHVECAPLEGGLGGGGGQVAPEERPHNSRYFVNVLSAGLSALGACDVEWFKWLGGLAYKLASVTALLRYRRKGLRVRTDGGEWSDVTDVTLVAMGNGRYFGGGLPVCPTAEPGDGQLEVVAIKGVGLLRFILQGHLIRAGKHLKMKGVGMWRSKRLELEEQ